MKPLRRVAVWLGLAPHDPLPRLLDCGDRNDGPRYECPDCRHTACDRHRLTPHPCRERQSDQHEREIW